MNKNPSLESVTFRRSIFRLALGWSLLVLAIVIWIPASDVIALIIRNRAVLFGRYSQGQFGALFFATLLFLGAAALCFSSIRTIKEMFFTALLVICSVLVSGFFLVIASGVIIKPRYIEKQVHANEAGIHIDGIVRHRPPNEVYHVVQEDKPDQLRSYPLLPPGYPDFNLTLTSDSYGFRNPTADGKLLPEYPVVAVGDSFVAGSHVSDEQAWVRLLSEKLNTPIYNLGVSGTDPATYLNNYVLLGRQFKPKTVLFMIYEGNDFKESSLPILESPNSGKSSLWKKWRTCKDAAILKIDMLEDASPVNTGLRRLSSEYMEAVGADWPVPGYAEKVGWMPLKISTGGREHYYSYEPKRLLYLYEEKELFRNSGNWKRVAVVMQHMVQLGKQDGFNVLFLYAPSTPHVVMPLMKDEISAEQLRNFASFQNHDLPDAETFKHNVFAWLDNEENVFLETCAAQKWNCMSLTKPLQEATARGEQVYYSYDQHWTPDGNRVVAQALYGHMESLIHQ